MNPVRVWFPKRLNDVCQSRPNRSPLPGTLVAVGCPMHPEFNAVGLEVLIGPVGSYGSTIPDRRSAWSIDEDGHVRSRAWDFAHAGRSEFRQPKNASVGMVLDAAGLELPIVEY